MHRPWRRRRARDIPAGDAAFASALLEELDEPVVACDAHGRLVVVNRRARELHGATGEPADPARWSNECDVYHGGTERPVDDDEMPLWRALAGEHVRDMFMEVQPRDGARRAVRVSGRPVAGPEGRVLGAVVVMHDVTEERAQESDMRLQAAILAGIADGVAIVRATDGELVYVNATWERMFGYRPGELVGGHIATLMAPDEQAPAQRAEEILGGLERDGRWQGEVENLRKDGTRFWSQARVSRFEHPEHGRVWLAVQSDITEHKAGELAVREAEERFRTVFEEGPVGIALADDRGRLLDVNEAFRDITGHAHDQLVRLALDDLTHPDDRDLDAGLSAQLASGELRRYRVVKRFVTVAGDTVPVALTVALVRDPAGRALYRLLIAEDPSARRVSAASGPGA